MQAEVISIGDELTSGERLDTNSQWLSQRLGELGIRTLYHSTVGDDLAANVRVVREALDRADVIVCTGGLGPTADDLTRQALAEATGTELSLDEASLHHIRSMFAKRLREMPERNRIQALFPAGSRPVPNPHGTAPGIHLEWARTNRLVAHLFALPGVPAEMREMWEQTVSPLLQNLTGGRRVIRHHSIKCFGVGESDLEQMLPDVIARGRLPSVGITVHKATITLRITAEAENEAACHVLMQPTIDTIHACLGDLVFGEMDDELQDAVVRRLRERGQRLATMEWGSGGLLAQWLGAADDGGGVFAGGVVVRSDASLGRALRGAIAGAASPDFTALVSSMASSVCEQFEADYGLAIGPLPASVLPDGQTPQLHFALATHSRTVIVPQAVPFVGHPDILKERGVKQALNLLRLELLRAS